MEIKVRVHTDTDGYKSARTVSINNGEIEQIISDYLKDQYLHDREKLESIEIESVLVA